MSFAPKTQQKRVVESFSNPEQPAYGQVATVDADQKPHVRTVHIHYREELKTLVFSCHRGSFKWKHLQENPYLAGCYFDMFRMFQFRWGGTTELIDYENKKHAALLDDMWLQMRPDVRKAYYLDHHGKGLQDNIDEKEYLNQRQPNHALVICHPTAWNIYEIDIADYAKGKCTEHQLTGETWESKEVSMLTGKPLAN